MAMPWLQRGGVISDWIRGHMMNVTDRADAVLPHELTQYGPVLQHHYGHQLLPLYFQREEIMINRSYLLQLEKVPLNYFLQKLTVRCLPLSNEGIIVDDFHVNLPHAAFMFGVFHVVHKVSEDRRYNISFEITRVDTSPP